MKIIFLDIDGVINPWRTPEKDSSGRFGREAMENFIRILDAAPDASIVITSTWRRHHSLSELKSIFGEAGIQPGRILDVTPDLRYTEGMIRHDVDRSDEIQAWLDQHPGVEVFAILDDVHQEQMEGFEEHFFQTEFEEGLTHKHATRIIDRLNAKP